MILLRQDTFPGASELNYCFFCSLHIGKCILFANISCFSNKLVVPLVAPEVHSAETDLKWPHDLKVITLISTGIRFAPIIFTLLAFLHIFFVVKCKKHSFLNYRLMKKLFSLMFFFSSKFTWFLPYWWLTQLSYARPCSDMSGKASLSLGEQIIPFPWLAITRIPCLHHSAIPAWTKTEGHRESRWCRSMHFG